jgi:nucleoside phosphorylase
MMAPLFEHKHHDRTSVFDPANLLREARRQKALPSGNVPVICVLDPDGDLFRHLKASGAQRNPYWACYHTELYELTVDDATVGVLGCAVGASFAVLVADLRVGGVWTTDAPFRETEEAIAFAWSENLLAVEMEAAALYALATAKGYPIVCFAHVTNQMGKNENDFEKGESDGNTAFIRLIASMSRAWRAGL